MEAKNNGRFFSPCTKHEIRVFSVSLPSKTEESSKKKREKKRGEGRGFCKYKCVRTFTSDGDKAKRRKSRSTHIHTRIFFFFFQQLLKLLRQEPNVNSEKKKRRVLLPMRQNSSNFAAWQGEGKGRIEEGRKKKKNSLNLFRYLLRDIERRKITMEIQPQVTREETQQQRKRQSVRYLGVPHFSALSEVSFQEASDPVLFLFSFSSLFTYILLLQIATAKKKKNRENRWQRTVC